MRRHRAAPIEEVPGAFLFKKTYALSCQERLFLGFDRQVFVPGAEDDRRVTLDFLAEEGA